MEWIGTPRLRVVVEENACSLPDAVRETVDRYWRESVLARHPYFFRGPVLNARSIERGDPVTIHVCFTDYAHYLYSRDHFPWDHPYRVRVIFAAGCLISQDGYFIAGIMGQQTTRPGWIQAIGGSAMPGEVKRGLFDPVASVRHEVLEEVGLLIDNPEVADPASVVGCTVDVNGSVAIAVRVPLHLTAEEAIFHANRHIAVLGSQGHVPELSEAIALPPAPNGLHWLESQQSPSVRYLKKFLSVSELMRPAQGG